MAALKQHLLQQGYDLDELFDALYIDIEFDYEKFIANQTNNNQNEKTDDNQE